jgi:hypothetical protein
MESWLRSELGNTMSVVVIVQILACAEMAAVLASTLMVSCT